MPTFRFFAVAALLAGHQAAAQAPDPAEWQNPPLTRQGQEAPRAAFQLYKHPANAADLTARSPWQQSLNGTWKFQCVGPPAARPLDCWQTIQVPGNWEVQGFGAPIYTNITYPSLPKNQPCIGPQSAAYFATAPVVAGPLEIKREGDKLTWAAGEVRGEFNTRQGRPTGLKPHQQTWLHVDLTQRGVSGDNSWGALPHDQYRLLAKQYSYSYTLRVLDGPEPSAPTSAAQKPLPTTTKPNE